MWEGSFKFLECLKLEFAVWAKRTLSVPLSPFMSPSHVEITLFQPVVVAVVHHLTAGILQEGGMQFSQKLP